MTDPFFNGWSLKEAQDYLVENAEEGVDCPCCTRWVKIYKRKLHAEMILWLVGLWHLSLDGEEWHSTLEIVARSKHLRAGGTNGTLLVHWGLIEKIDAENRAGGPIGQYRITTRGKKFLADEITVPSHVHLLCNQLVGYSDTYLAASECVGEKFDFDELMEKGNDRKAS